MPSLVAPLALNKPVIVGTDVAIWDRIRLIPFNKRFADNPDTGLPAKLAEERAGIFAWMVLGALDWHENGLGCPEAMAAATEEYREEMDTLGDFLEARCVVEANATAAAAALYKQYEMWCPDAGEHPDTQRAFGLRLSERGFDSFRYSGGVNKGRKGWRGIGIQSDRPDPTDGDESFTSERSAGNRSLRESSMYKPDTPDSSGSGEPSEPKNDINGSKHASEGVTADSGSLHSPEPISHNAKPEDGAISLVELKHRESIVGELKRKGSGGRLNLAHYLRGDTTLEILTRSVLVGLGKDADGWQQHAPVVDAAAKDPQNHPLDCECEACL